MTAYADYSYYTGTYLGTAITSPAFGALALRASAVIDQITFNRAAPIVAAAVETETIDLIKKAMCNVAEELQRQDAAGGADAVRSESVGSYSVTYADQSSAMRTNQDRLGDAANLWLANTGLLFRGFASGEYGGALSDED